MDKNIEHEKDLEAREEEIITKPRSKFTIVLAFLVLLLLISNVATVYYILYAPKDVEDIMVDTDKIEDPASNDVLDEPEEMDEDPEEDLDTQTDDEIVEEIEKIVDDKRGGIVVEWNTWPVLTDTWGLFDYMQTKEIFESYVKSGQYVDTDNYDNFLNKMSIYKSGRIKEGVYKGDDLYIVTYRPEGPSFRDNMHRVIKSDTGLIVLNQHSDSLWGIYEKIFAQNDNIKIDNIETVTEIPIPNSELRLIKRSEEPFKLLMNYDDPKPVFSFEGNEVYKDASGCFIVRAPDGTVRDYYIDLDFAQDKGEGDYLQAPNLLDITWENGEQNKYDYDLREVSGCAMKYCLNYVTYVDSLDDLVTVGETSSGDKIYELKDTETKVADRDQSVLEGIYRMAFMGEENDLSFDDFLGEYPLIFWQDPFGGFVAFKNSKFQAMAECGKPVIYLYPEEETDIQVYVEPNGGFTETIPSYQNGWKVSAKPSGELFNYSDKLKYPYLFWEGYAMDYKRSDKGFMVAREKVEDFLLEKLSLLGLVEKEYDEFIEFWLPRMQEKPFYFVSFMDQADFEEYAPLTVIPKPDTIIRVFMDYEALDAPINVQPQELETPERIGFTVVEWGGALHR